MHEYIAVKLFVDDQVYIVFTGFAPAAPLQPSLPQLSPPPADATISGELSDTLFCIADCQQPQTSCSTIRCDNFSSGRVPSRFNLCCCM